MVHSSVFTDGPRSGLISPIRGSSETLQLPLVPPPHPHTWGVSVGWGGPNLFDVKERAALICVHGSGWRCVSVYVLGGDQLSTGCWCVLCRWWNCGFGDLVREWWSGEGKKRNCKVDIHGRQRVYRVHCTPPPNPNFFAWKFCLIGGVPPVKQN